MTDIPTIAALPAPPQRGQDANVFVQRADAFIDALAAFVAQLNAFGAQLVLATQERVVNEAAGSYAGAITARDAALAARDAAQAYAASINPANLVNLTANQAIAGTKNFTGILQLAGAAITAAATFPEALTADMLANVDKRLLSVRAAWNALVPVVLADAPSIALDLNTGIHFTVTLAGNRTLAAPTNGKPGQEGFIRVVQDGTGGRALSFAAAYKFPDLATAPSLNAAAATVTLLRYHVSAAGEVFISGGKPNNVNVAATLSSHYDGTGAPTYSFLYSPVARTFSYKYLTTSGNSQTCEIAKSTAANPTSFTAAVSAPPNGQAGTITVEAGATIRFTCLSAGLHWLYLQG
jgi:hypothetical protein